MMFVGCGRRPCYHSSLEKNQKVPSTSSADDSIGRDDPPLLLLVCCTGLMKIAMEMPFVHWSHFFF